MPRPIILTAIDAAAFPRRRRSRLAGMVLGTLVNAALVAAVLEWWLR